MTDGTYVPKVNQRDPWLEGDSEIDPNWPGFVEEEAMKGLAGCRDCRGTGKNWVLNDSLYRVNVDCWCVPHASFRDTLLDRLAAASEVLGKAAERRQPDMVKKELLRVKQEIDTLLEAKP